MTQLQLKYFIWDFDGTLLDTYPHTTTAFVNVLKRHGKEVDFDEAMNLLRFSFEAARKHFELTEEMWNDFLHDSHILWFEPNPVPYDEIADVLETVVKSGGKNYLYTHRNNTSLEYLKHYDLLKYFDDVVTFESEAFAFKPKPDCVNYLVDKHSLNRELTCMVGDREVDIGSGKNADCKAILFDQRFLSPQTEADVTVTNLAQIKDFILK